MNRKYVLGFLAVFVLTTLAAGAFGFYAGDAQKPAPERGKRPPGSDRPAVGQAVPRRPPPPAPPRPGVPGRTIHPYPYAYGYPYPPAPFWYSYPYPYGYPVPPAYVFAERSAAVLGGLRLDVTPKDAVVYLDGYYAGIVDDFDGIFGRLSLAAGPHTIEILKTEFETLVLDAYIQPRLTITYRESMRPAQRDTPSGEAASPEAGGPGATAPPGDLRLDVTPKNAQVYVDGFFMGLVDDFSGRDQRVTLAPGPHHVELRAAGYEPLEFDINVEPRKTLDYRAGLTLSKP